MKGWPIVYTGITLLSLGMWAYSGIDFGLITGGIALILAGIMQVTTS